MTTQNYCMVQNANNICENVVVWDGNPNTWAPPSEYLMLVQATTPAKVWSWNMTDQVWLLTEQTGAGSIGFVWDGTFLTTNEPMPPKPPVTTVAGTQTL